jgi:outer membrane lipoprotein carrier protein
MTRLVAFMFAICAPAALAGPIEQLQAFVDSARAARADFTQVVTDGDGKTVQTSSGTFEFSRPGKFRWQYTQPFEQVLVADGKTLWIYDKDLNQVTSRRLDQALGSTPAAILAGADEIERYFSLEAQKKKDKLEWLQVKPYDEDNMFERVRMGFNKNNLEVMELYDNFGQKTVIRFSKLERSPKFPPNVFSFTPPPGADVVTE